MVAVRSFGASTPRILFRHILPHLIPTLIVWGCSASPPRPCSKRR